MQKTLKALKQKGHRIALIIVTLLLAMAMFPATVFAAPDGTATFVAGAPDGGMPTEGYALGDEFTVPFRITDNPGFTTGGFEVRFDPQVLEFVPGSFNYAAPSIFTDGMWTNIPNVSESNLAAGRIALATMYMPGVMGTSDYMGNGLLFTARFKIKSDAMPGTSSIVVGLASDDNPNNFVNMASARVPFNYQPLVITVKDNTPPPPDPAWVTVGSVTGTVEPDNTFTIPITIADNPGFAGAAFTLGFNSSALELISLNAETALLEGNLLSDVSAATVEYASDAGIVAGDGTLFFATFRVRTGAAAGTYPITIGLKDGNASNFVDNASAPLEVNFVAGSVSVTAPPVTYDKTTIVVGGANGEPGTTVTIPVTVRLEKWFASGALMINYDHSLLTLVELSPGSDLPTGTVIAPLPIEQDRFLILGTSNIESDIKLFDLVFEIKMTAPAGDTSVSLSIFNPSESNFVNANGDLVPVDFVAGTVVIEEPTVPFPFPSGLDFPAFDEADTWVRVYNGMPQSILVGIAVAGGAGTVTVFYNGSLTAPTVVGDYTVAVSVTGVPGYIPITVPQILGTLKIIKAPAPSITWPTASDITYGQSLSDVVLSGGSTEFGSFAWDSSVDLTKVLDAGTYYCPVVFTPNANTLQNYEAISPLTQNVEVIVKKAAAPVIIVWPTASTIREGQALSASVLTPSSNVYGTFAWTDGTIMPAAPGGSYQVTFTPSAATLNNYETIAVVTQNVNVKVVVPGDIDGSGGVSALDAMRILQHASGLITLTGDALIAADLDGDGSITAADAMLAARRALGL